ncbi:MAG: hypothetical protein V3S68_04835 [Dehalococcoidia bacterium]
MTTTKTPDFEDFHNNPFNPPDPTSALYNPPECNRCLTDDKVSYIGTGHTVFGGMVVIWVCFTCGTTIIMSFGKRP